MAKVLTAHHPPSPPFPSPPPPSTQHVVRAKTQHGGSSTTRGGKTRPKPLNSPKPRAYVYPMRSPPIQTPILPLKLVDFRHQSASSAPRCCTEGHMRCQKTPSLINVWTIGLTFIQPHGHNLEPSASVGPKNARRVISWHPTRRLPTGDRTRPRF